MLFPCYRTAARARAVTDIRRSGWRLHFTPAPSGAYPREQLVAFTLLPAGTVGVKFIGGELRPNAGAIYKIKPFSLSSYRRIWSRFC